MLPGSCFVMGYDTFVRLLDIKYYDHSEEKLCQILELLDEVNT
jgi:hypothetical protein